MVGFAGVVMPHPVAWNETGLIAIQATCLAFGIGLLVFAGYVPTIFLRVLPILAIAMTTGAIFATGDATSAYAFFYLWPCLYSFIFLSRGDAAITVAYAIANYAAAMALIGDPPPAEGESDYYYLVLLAGTLIVAGGVILYLRDRVERLMGRLGEAEHTDLLTELPNARALLEILDTELEVARLERSQVSVLVCDLDRFKAVNESLGRRGGDELLRSVADLCREETRADDVVARTGPNEFTIVLRERAETEAYLMAEQLLGRVRRSFRSRSVTLTTSIGIATYPTHAGSAEDLVKLAERAVDTAKLLGRDRAIIFSLEAQEVLRGSMRQPSDAPAHLATMVCLAEALDLRDATTAEHSKRVGRFAKAIALELGLNDHRAERVRLAGILHDIGKVGVPDAILAKPGPLEPAEWKQMRKHPEMGARILGTRELVDIRAWVLASHERPDGSGYPRGAAGVEIPLEGRILAVAEAFESMTADRVYRPALGDEAAREELLAGAGAQFDAEVVDALLRVLDRGCAIR